MGTNRMWLMVGAVGGSDVAPISACARLCCPTGQLTAMTENFHLADNELTGTIPSELGERLLALSLNNLARGGTGH